MFDFINGKGARSPQPSPSEEVDDFIYDHDNYFGDLEDAAEALRRRLRRRSGTQADALVAHLAQQHGVTFRYCSAQEVPEPGHRYDGEARRLDLSEALSEPSIRFQIARLAARLEAAEVIAKLAASPSLTTEESRSRGEGALASYFAGALMFPYDDFRQAAMTVRHDIGILQQRFGGSFEQICHRLTTLRRPGEEGLPFHFVRTDVAGNMSKRFSASGLRLPRYGGACPRWALYQAFRQPGEIVRQLASMPDGTVYLFVAATVSKPAPAYRAPTSHHAIMIGCDISAARHVVYGDGLDPAAKSLLTPVGVSCRQCPRENCAQRAFAHLTGAEQGPDSRPGLQR
jgi:predicted transcriptional regulator